MRTTTRNMEVVEDFGLGPHQLVRLEVRCNSEPQEVRDLKAPKLLPGVSGEKSTFSGRQHVRRSKCDEQTNAKCHRRNPRTHESNRQGWDPCTP